MGFAAVFLKFALPIIFLSVHQAMVIPQPPALTADAPDLSNSLETASPTPTLNTLVLNGTRLNRRKRCQRPLIIIFYSRSSTIQPFRSFSQNGQLRLASGKSEKLTLDERTAMQKCLKKYGEVTQVCALLANMTITAPLKDATNSSLAAKIVDSILE